MSLADEIRNEIENIKELKITVGDINNHLSVLEGLTRKDIEEREKEAYQRGYDDGYEAGCATAFKPVSDAEYQRGLNDAWDAAKKLGLSSENGGMKASAIREIFDGAFPLDVFMNYTAKEAIDKIKAYEDKQKDRIEVGDEVIWKTDDVTLIVTSVYESGDLNWCDGVAQDGKVYHTLTENNQKTGNHYDIASVLGAMRK